MAQNKKIWIIDDHHLFSAGMKQMLAISPETVKPHLATIYKTIACENRDEVVEWARNKEYHHGSLTRHNNGNTFKYGT